MIKIGYYKGSLAIEILEYLYRTGGIPRKNLYTPFASKNYKYFSKTVVSLMEQGYIELYRYKKLNHVRITEAGLALAQEKTENEQELKKQAPKLKNNKAKKRQLLVNDVLGLCEGNNFLTINKPPLQDLFIPGEETESEWEQAIEQGVFYSSRELRNAYMEIRGQNEIMNLSRLVGITIYKGHVSYVYSVINKLIQWQVGSEDRTVKNIEDFLNGSRIIQGTLTDTSRCAIIVGRGYSMIPKIVTGRRYARYEDSAAEPFRAHLAKTHINSHNLSKVFASAYYAQASRPGVEVFRTAALLSQDIKNYLVDAWFEKVSGVRRARSYRYSQGLNGKGERVVYMPCIDLIELEFYRSQNTPCHFVVPKGCGEAVSRVMGPLLLSVQDLQGNKMNPARYDYYGNRE